MTTSIIIPTQFEHIRDGRFAAATDDHPELQAWVEPPTAGGFALGAVARATGKRLKITYDQYIDNGPGDSVYRGVSAIEIV